MMECGSVAQPRFGCIPAHDPFLGKFLEIGSRLEKSPKKVTALNAGI
jgi:hypothetical protein